MLLTPLSLCCCVLLHRLPMLVQFQSSVLCVIRTSVGASLLLRFRVTQEGSSGAEKTRTGATVCTGSSLLVDIMGSRCRLTAATEESTACTNSHIRKEPTNTQMHKHRQITTGLCGFFFCHSNSLASFVFLVFFF